LFAKILKVLSTLHKALNTPNQILLKKLKKKLNKVEKKTDDIYLSLDSFVLKSGLLKIDKEFFNEHIIEIENCVDKSLSNEFKIFTEDYICVSNYNNKPYNKINWQKDQLSGFEWDINSKSKNINFGIGENEKNVNFRKYIGAEIKYPWELGRQQDLLNVAIFFTICSEESKKNEIIDFYKNRIYDFSENNPIGFGVQWQTSMDIAIRVVNYLISYDILKSNGAVFDEEFEQHFTQLMISHYYYIFDNLEYSDGMRGNHYFANLMGLIVVYSYMDLSQIGLNESDKIKQIFEFALNSFSEEVLYQFLNDGGNFEASVPYHFFASEMLLICIYFLERIEDFSGEKIKKIDNELLFSDDVRNRIKNVIDFCTNFIINGNIPNIGDNDSGFVLDFIPYENKRAGLIWLLSHNIEGKEEIKFEKLQNVINRLLFQNQSYFLGDWFGIARASNKHFDLIAFAGGKGQNGKGGHSHNDKCSFELYFEGKPFIVDLGSAFYTSNWMKRNYYRSVNQHNVLHIGREQELILANERDDLFWLYGNKSKPEIVFANDEKMKLTHQAYKKEYERNLNLDENSLKGNEKLDLAKEKIISFHFHNEVKIFNNSNNIEIEFLDRKFIFKGEGDIKLKKCYYSPEYGIEKESMKIELKSKSREINWEISLIED